MNRRKDDITAENVKLTLLTKAAFGLDAAVHVAMFYQLPIDLIGRILARHRVQIRSDVREVITEVERRRKVRL